VLGSSRRRREVRIPLMWNTRIGDREHVGLGLGA